MAPSCVLLERLVEFVDHPVVATRSHLGIIREEAATRAVFSGFDEGKVLNWEAITEGVSAHLRAMKPDPQLLDPPAVSYLSMVRPDCDDDSVLQWGFQYKFGDVATTYKNLVVIYVGEYRAGNCSEGCYLVYDAASNLLSTVPGIPYAVSKTSVGNGTTIMAPQDGSFVLAELFTNFPRGVLCLWSQEAQRWEEKVGRLPDSVCPLTHRFRADLAFSFNNNIYWVDLLYGVLSCNLDAEFCVFQLPPSLSITTTRYYQLAPEEFRSMACVAGTIKFFTMDGYLEHSKPGNEVALTTWTLNIDYGGEPQASWTLDTRLCLGDLWADESFTSRDLPRIKPMFPVLSTQQHDVVYLLLVDSNIVANHRTMTVQHLISVDTRCKKILSSSKYNSQGDCWPNLIATDFNLYLQRGAEAIGSVNGKRLKI